MCLRGLARRPGARTAGPVCPNTLAKKSVTWNVWDLGAVAHGAMCALARAEVCGAKVTGLADGTDLEAAQSYVSCGQATRTVRAKHWRRPVHEIAVTVWGWNILLQIDAATMIPLTVR